MKNWKVETEAGVAGGLSRKGEARFLVRCDEADTVEGMRLLAEAAPRLLAALEALFRECSIIHKHWGEDCNQKQSDAAIAAAMAAVKQARGEHE